MKPKLIVHGGAWSIPNKMIDPHLLGVEQAIRDVYPLLDDGMSALDAVERAVNILEEDPTYDSGRGAFLNARGEIELDAMIMNGIDLNIGAVAALQNLLYPISVARMVMDRTEHAFMVGCGAQDFAKSMGFVELDPKELLTERELEFWHKVRNDPDFESRDVFRPKPKGTVGAVAMDEHGNLAAATSTGGSPRKLPGRVGDSPIPGAGTWVDNLTAGCSVTGWGEAIMKVMLAKHACDLTTDMGAMMACRSSIEMLKQRVDGDAGLIMIDRHGNYGYAHNTDRMAFAYWDTEKGLIARIEA